MIQFDKIDGNAYKEERAAQLFKYKNSVYIEQFNTVIESAIQGLDIDGLIRYKNGDKKETIDRPFLYYNYGSPAPWLGKLLPEGYGFLHFQPNEIYKKCKVEHGIQQKLLTLYNSGKFTRYPQPALKQVTLPDNFILVAMQNTGSTVWYRKDFTKLAKEIVAWSRESKRHVVFKWHNGCIDHSNPIRWFAELNEHSDYASIDYTTPIYHLIKKCDMLWTASSMSGIEALICNKPVAIFGETEYMEMTAVCESPEQAINTTIPKDLEQWLTYYVRHYCINIYGTDAVDRIRQRVVSYFDQGLSLDELILL